jgi:hypothetical protein
MATVIETLQWDALLPAKWQIASQSGERPLKSVSRLVSRRVGIDNRTPEIISLAENRAKERIKVAEGHCTKSFLNMLAGRVQGFIWLRSATAG